MSFLLCRFLNAIHDLLALSTWCVHPWSHTNAVVSRSAWLRSPLLARSDQRGAFTSGRAPTLCVHLWSRTNVVCSFIHRSRLVQRGVFTSGRTPTWSGLVQGGRSGRLSSSADERVANEHQHHSSLLLIKGVTKIRLHVGCCTVLPCAVELLSIHQKGIEEHHTSSGMAIA